MSALERSPHLWILGLLLILLAAGVASAQGGRGETSPDPAQPSAPENWPHFGYDNAYTANNPIESKITISNVVQMERVWGIGCDDPYFSVIFRSPAVYSGTLYTSGAGSRLTAYNARSGQQLWQFGNGNLGWAPQPVASEDGTVFYMEETFPTYLYAVDGQSGTQVWQAPIGFELGYSGAAQALVTVDETNGLVYLVESSSPSEGKLYAMDKQTGEISWYMGEVSHDAIFRGSYVLLGNGKIYAAADVPMAPYPGHGDHMLQIDPLSQTIEMTYTRPAPENYYHIEQYTLCNDKLVVGYDYQYDPVKIVAGYDLISSTILWQKNLSTTVSGMIACNPAKNQVYVPTDPYLYALDADSGSEVWTYTGYGAIYNPSLANGIVYFLSDNNMYAIDEESGTRLFNFPLGYAAEETTQVAIADGMLYFSGNGGTCDLFALGLLDYKVYLPVIPRGQ